LSERPAFRPPHGPDAGIARRLLGRFHVTGVFWYRFHRFGVSAVPSWAVAPFVALFTSLFFLFLFRIRKAIAANLEPVLGPCGALERQRRIWRTMWSFAWNLTERYERLATRRTFDVRVEGKEIWDRVAGSGEGFVLVTAHLGNYEVGSMLPADKEARMVHLVREPEASPEAQRFLEETIRGLGTTHYRWHFERDDPLQGLALLEALRRGEVVAMQADRPRAGGTVVDATLFGRPFPLPPGPAALARTAQAVVLPAFVFRTGRRRYRLVFRCAVRPERTRDRRADVAAATREVGEQVEWAIREAPHQWFLFRRLWEPDGSLVGSP
jgi:lauroyl/myristoyl acyltransferase